MQKPNEQKRRRILAAAAGLFAERPFHDVRLEEVAAQAGVGKGTIYIYFPGKEELYLALVDEGFTQLVAQLSERHIQAQGSARAALRAILAALVHFAVEFPHLAELMRSNAGGPGTRSSKARSELTQMLEETLRRGIRRREFSDPHPELTALCIPGLVRSVMLFGPRTLDERGVTRHLVRLLERGLNREAAR
ncbi:MAG: TetR/AcrR family transcriptional regulator [Planctomycetes bacterium]|nr:TetR/AcrR family transcriptional regulator [Planctomycetota bacterium]